MTLGPFKIVPHDVPGGADVVDRVTGERVGLVLKTFGGTWEAIIGNWYIGTTFAYRRDAAWDVWNHRAREIVETAPL